MRGLSLCLPQKVLPQSGHQMHFQVERGYCKSTSEVLHNLESMLIVGRIAARRRGKDQPSNPPSIPDHHQRQRELVLPLWLHVALGQEECQKVFR